MIHISVSYNRELNEYKHIGTFLCAVSIQLHVKVNHNSYCSRYTAA